MNEIHTKSVNAKFLVLILCTLFQTSGLANDKNLQRISSYDAVPGEVLIKFKNPSIQKNKSAAINRYKISGKSRFFDLGIEHWKLDSSEDLSSVINELKKDPDVEIVEPNYRRYPRANHTTIKYPQNYARLNDLRLPELWKIEQTAFRKLNKVKIAVIDDAFDLSHPDLKNNVFMPYDALNGRNKPLPELCVYLGTNEPKLDKNNEPYYESHGTKVMGVVGATSGNNKGIDGAGDNALIIPIRVSCNYTLAATLEAMQYAIDQKVNIILAII